jgi:hypothetical protein
MAAHLDGVRHLRRKGARCPRIETLPLFFLLVASAQQADGERPCGHVSASHEISAGSRSSYLIRFLRATPSTSPFLAS